MTDPRPDPVDELLSGLRVPPPSPDLIGRIVAEAQQADRVPSPAVLPATRPRPRCWPRRSVWTAMLAINLAVASAVAAALGSGAIDGSRLIASARHAVERLAHPHAAAPTHHLAPHPRRPAALLRPAAPTRPLEAARPLVEQPPVIARPPPPRAPAVRITPRVVHARDLPFRATLRGPHPQRVGPAWRQRPMAGAAARRMGPEREYARDLQRSRFGPSRGLGRPGVYRPRFDGPRFGRFGGARPRFRSGGSWRARRGGPRRRF